MVQDKANKASKEKDMNNQKEGIIGMKCSMSSYQKKRRKPHSLVVLAKNISV